MPPEISLVIVHYRDPDSLDRCLRSISSLSDEVPSAEVIVVDNHTPDWDSGSWNLRYPRVHFIARPDNGGYAVGVNTGIRQARGRNILILNCDTLIHLQALSRLCRFVETHPEAGLVGCQIRNADGHVEPSYRAFPRWWTPLVSRYSPLTLLWPNNPWSHHYLYTRDDHRVSRRVDWVSGACMLVTRRALEKVGEMDEGFFMYMEDVDYCLRMHQCGWEVWYVPDAVISHTGGTANDQAKYRSIVNHHRSIWRYYGKHVRGGNFKKSLIGAGVLLRLAFELIRTAVAACFRARGGAGYREAYLKRPMDVLLALVGLLLTLPLWCLTPWLIWLQDRGPVFYRQPRVGRYGRTFEVFKFRTMRVDADEIWGPAQTRHSDPRVTALGHWLRKAAIDEIPQLVNILKGDMSLVGPRALMPEEVEARGEATVVALQEIAGWRHRVLMRPGLTGIAQVYAPRDLPRRRKFRYDLLYLRGCSIFYDFYLIIYSVFISLTGRWDRRGHRRPTAQGARTPSEAR